jgi:acyl-CoA reductase-like NAD-dependent aldehyde dehydrogenase
MMHIPVYDIYAGGRFIATDKLLEVRSPYSGEIFAHTYLAGKKELDQSIKKAQAVKKQLSGLPSFQKYEILLFISNEIKKDRERLASVLAYESAKPMRYSLAEIDRAAQTFLVAAEECKRLPKEFLSLDWTPAGKGKEGIVKYFPSGLVAGIAPFNFPMNLAVHKIAPAIAAGCPIILKPASATPLSTLELAKIIEITDLPKGAVSILPMNREEGQQLVEDERFSLLSFTGSVPVGWKMKEQGGKKKVVLELGGNAAVVIAKSADIELAVEKCIVAAFAYSGQICIHAQRFFVHKSHYKKFVNEMVKRTKSLKYGDPQDMSTEVSSMIDADNALRTEKWVKEALKKGATLLCGGERKGSYYSPTILTGTTSSMKVCAEEVFAPVITIEQYDTIEEAITLVNDSRFGLQASVFTNDISELDKLFAEIETGSVIHNDAPSFRVDHMPYGGVKDSGLGREGIRYAIMDMMEPRLLVRSY